MRALSPETDVSMLDWNSAGSFMSVEIGVMIRGIARVFDEPVRLVHSAHHLDAQVVANPVPTYEAWITRSPDGRMKMT
jgi:hypothetical protein